MTTGTDDPRDLRPLRVGVVGAGLISTYHLTALAALDDVELQAVVAGRPDSARARAAEYGVAAFTDWRELVGVVDAAVVATPDHTHPEIAAGLMTAGIPVLVQKPLAPSAAEAHALVAGAPYGLLSASFMHRFLDATVQLAEVLRRGDLGDIMSARLRNATPGPDWGEWFFREAGPTAGVIGQLGVHGIDLVEHLLGDIRSVQAVVATRMPQRRLRDGTSVRSRVPDHALATYVLEGGILVSHEQCWAEAGGTERFRMEVHGTRASAVLAAPSAEIEIFERGGAVRRPPLEREAVLGLRHHRHWAAVARRRQDDGSGRAAERGLRIAEAIARAAETRQTIDIPPERTAS